MSSLTPAGSPTAADESQLAALGYSGDFHRSMSLWSNLALGFTYLSPLVGVYSLFAYSLSLGGPPAIWWIIIVGFGQLLVALVFGEVVSQYPLAGGIYPWCRRLWNRRYAWIVSWVYIWAVIVTVTAVAEFGGGFVAALFDIEATPEVGLATAAALLLIALAAGQWLAGAYVREARSADECAARCVRAADRDLPVRLLAPGLTYPRHSICCAGHLHLVPGGGVGGATTATARLASAGVWNLGSAGMVVNVLALAYGIFAMILLARPTDAESFLDRWVVLIGAIIVIGAGLSYLFVAKPYERSADVPEGDALEVAEQLRRMQREGSARQP